MALTELQELTNAIEDPDETPKISQGFQIIIPIFEGDMDEYESLDIDAEQPERHFRIQQFTQHQNRYHQQP